MKPIQTSKRILELYSNRRNRNIYPNPSSFEVNFAPTVHPHCGEKIISDPVCKGAIYYKMVWQLQYREAIGPGGELLAISIARGNFGEGTTNSKLILNFDNEFKNDFLDPYFNYTNSFVGWRIYKINQDFTYDYDYRIITSYDPSTNIVSVNKPFQTNNLTTQPQFILFSNLPTKWSIYIPTFDINRIVINKTPLYYNGYYVVFETENSNYSNSSNSNIFSRRISYYDNETQLAYFDEPLPFEYIQDKQTSNQTWTLRKSLPLERWSIDTPTYYNNKIPLNPLIGPLQGYVLTLPEQASSIDNYYRGKYIYTVSNSGNDYSPPLPPQNEILPLQGEFYPIYGLFYIRAYNGKTKEVSLEKVINKFTSVSNNIFPTYELLNINSGSFINENPKNQLVNVGGGVYKLIPDNTMIYEIGVNYFFPLSITLLPQQQYKITISTRKINGDGILASIVLQNGITQYYPPYTNFILNDSYTTYTFVITTQAGYDKLNFSYTAVSFDNPGLNNIEFEWNYLQIEKFDTINIVELDYDNYSPLDYNGTMVSTNQTVCYEMYIESLTLPNKNLLTGSSIAFYPFVYVQIENVTSPTSTSPNTIISNNPPSSKAVFTVYVPQVDNPDIQKFVSLTGGGTQIVKFKPNDNLRFSVYLPDGSPFQTLLPDTLSPYPPDPELQIHAVFSLLRIK